MEKKDKDALMKAALGMGAELIPEELLKDRKLLNRICKLKKKKYNDP